VTAQPPRILADWGDAHPSSLFTAVAARRAAGAPLTDLITANPQEHGCAFPQGLLADIMREAVAAAEVYQPDPRGQPAAREAVAQYHGGGVSPDQVVLSPGTSLAYLYAFRLLGEPGDEILCPSPTYPLFDDLARLAGIGVRRYHLHDDAGRWTIDPDELSFQVTPRTRAIAIVSPHNPTGSVANDHEVAAACEVARRHGIAVVFDEVFREFPHTARHIPRPGAFGAPLSITLNGFSKMFSLPGMKAAWMVVEGQETRRSRFLNAVEYVSDTLLPVNEMVQAAMPRLLAEGLETTRRIAGVFRGRMGELVAAWNAEGVALPHPEAGVYLPVALKGIRQGTEHNLALRLVADEGILLHPGSFYGLSDPFLVMTCVHPSSAPVIRIASVYREIVSSGG
jgi:hypothetical protein